ncbi:MAG: DUF5107 domain-containing protein [Gemmatimonadota bacterium]|nr:DUF5107 domain-containing protein [Gemmatimonadota bacterium]
MKKTGRRRKVSAAPALEKHESSRDLDGQVRLCEEPLRLPAYRTGPPEPMPNWAAKVYPYPMLDRLTDEAYERTFRALVVENEWIKVTVLPELGGKLFGARDKTNGYEIFYDLRTIKPGLVGLTGAWCTGGIEYNFPDGHRPSGFGHTDWRMVENSDGSKTIWTGEIDRITGMRWSVGHTVHPGRNWVETRTRLYNCTPFMHNFQYWATAAVRATPGYRSVVSGEIAAGHYNESFYPWPVHQGRDLRWWGNIEGHTSFFAWRNRDNFFGGYSPEENAGLVHWADHNVVPGKKMWTWGTCPAGRLWERILSDDDLPYLEPQAGAYSDNQPDYHWIAPGETKTFSNFWFPVRDIGVWDYASLEGAVSLKLKGSRVLFGWSPTAPTSGATVIVTADGVKIFERTVDADPGHPLVAQLEAPEGKDLYSLALTVLDSSGERVLEFSHRRPTSPPLPEPDPPAPEPARVETVEELYLLGDHNERFHHPKSALEAYHEALRRDPGDSRTNVALGLIGLKKGLFQEALDHFYKALERNPASGKAHYYKGLAHLYLGQTGKGGDNLNRAAYEEAFYAAAHVELAGLCAADGDSPRALMHIERSLAAGGDNSQAHSVKTLILNLLGCHSQALEKAEQVQLFDPMNFLALSEQAVALENLGRSGEAAKVRETLFALTRGDSENHLELAICYARCGRFEQALAAIEALTGPGGLDPGGRDLSPMLYYYGAWYSSKLGLEEKATGFRASAAGTSPSYCFPNRLESFPVLDQALARDPADGRALYYLGNLYYSRGRALEAIECFKKAVALEPGNAVAWRNLGHALDAEKDFTGAREAYLSAIEADPGADVAITELDQVNKRLRISFLERIALFEKHLEAVRKSSEALIQLAFLYTAAGRYADALEWIKNNYFRCWEGMYNIHQYWVEASLGRGDEEFASGNYGRALELYRQSLEYPANMEAGELPKVVHSAKLNGIARALAALGCKQESVETYERSVGEEVKMSADSAFRFHLGRALEALGREDEARKVYQDLLAEIDRRAETGEGFVTPVDLYFDPELDSKALGLYKRSVALEALGCLDEAQAERARALELDPAIYFRAFRPPNPGW